nr:retrovirus-related Pol polyprotein from transposon TNT 1-94 [Tanacetum cinerariifolium]
MKSKAPKEQTTVSRPIKALTVYPPNTPAMLFPRVLPIKSQVKIHIFTLLQLFSEFDKPCKKRITPTGLTEGERGFEQTKECYLRETIIETRCLELEAKLSNLRDKSHNDNHDELVNRFSNLEVNHLNLQLKYQNLKDSLGNISPKPDKDTLDFDSVFVIGVNSCTDASRSPPRSNTKKNRISPAKGVNKLQVEEQHRTNKSPLRTSNRVDSSSRPKCT